MMHPRKGEFFSSRVRYISLNQIRPNPQQPRRSFDEDSLSENDACGPPPWRDCGRCRVWWRR